MLTLPRCVLTMLALLQVIAPGSVPSAGGNHFIPSRREEGNPERYVGREESFRRSA